ncbi:MAG TPA: HD domain-containing phosphohydrolase [Spirochaetia bacterium]|nr:HD domain-containing phosphohydrolase [Spirochaetia bacterium]
MDSKHDERGTERALEVEDLDEPPAADTAALLGSSEFTLWRTSFLTDRIPSLFLDKRLKIVKANESFCRMYGCDEGLAGMYFTQFYHPFFDEKKSGELFRAILSPAAGFTWNGPVEKAGINQLLTVSKVWVIPMSSTAHVGDIVAQAVSAQPQAYCAMCLDISQEHRQNLQNTFASLLTAAQLKDNDTGHHVERVNLYARALAEDLLGRSEGLEVDQSFVESIGQVAALHDMGKIGTPDDILNKAGPLESWEWEVMKEHTKNGAYILQTYPNPMASQIALRHHERWDGTGYPHGLNEDLIPISARVVALADVYDALRMRRPYKEELSHHTAVETMRAERGTHFDPALLDRFIAIRDRLDEIFSGLEDAP